MLNFSITFYFEIKDADIYGGKGSTGYMSTSIDGLHSIDDVTDKQIINYKICIAKTLGFDTEKMRFITKNEYEANTED